jgi:hypothetical protein
MKRRSSIVHIGMLLSSGVVLAIAVSLYVFMYYKTEDMTGAATSSRQAMTAMGQDQSQIKETLSLYQSTAADRARLHSFLVPSGNAVAFIKAIEAVGRSSGAAVSISSISEDHADSGAPIGTGDVRAVISAAGSWPDVMKALVLLEMLPYRVTISHVLLSTSVISGSKPDVSRHWQMNLDIFAPTL